MLFIELKQQHVLYTFGYCIQGLAGIALYIFSFKLSSFLLTMGRAKRKWVLEILYLMQLAMFAAHLIITGSLLLNYHLIYQIIAIDELEWLRNINAFRSITIFLGSSSLLLGVDFLITIYFRRFLGREQIRLEDRKVMLREVELYQEVLTSMQA